MIFMVLGQMFLGFSTFTKNEGILFFFCFNAVVLSYVLLNKKEARKLLKIFLFGLSGAIVSLITVGIFKSLIHNPTKMFFVSSVSVTLVSVVKRIKVFLLYMSSYLFQIEWRSLFWYVVLIASICLRKEFVRGKKSILTFTIIAISILYFLIFLFRSDASLSNLQSAAPRFYLCIFCYS